MAGLTEVRRPQGAEESLETELCLSTQPVHFFGEGGVDNKPYVQNIFVEQAN